jgi:3-vinyl bacteriochlorophyllide hydratase
MHHRKSAPWTSNQRLEGPPWVIDRNCPSISHHSVSSLSIRLYNTCCGRFTVALRAVFAMPERVAGENTPPPALYTAEERRRRDASPWTIVQGVLAPIQFAVFLISLCLVIRYLVTGDGLALATASIVLKTCLLYAIMITGSIWEREVFGRYLFARPFFWEDVFSILVLALHTLYLAGLVMGALTVREQMLVALAAYAAYVVNATQFLLKLRAARRSAPADDAALIESVR